MLLRLFDKIHRWERSLHSRWGRDISTPSERRKSWWHFQLLDHGVLRHLWTNFDEIAPGVYRSNQPDAKRLRRYKDMGIKTILNLRGVSAHSPYLFEKEACDALGLNLVNIAFSARHAPKKEPLLDLVDRLATLEKPFLLHCKSGADRAGMVAAIYLLTQCDADIETAKGQLSFRYLHLKNTKTGIMDQVLESYQARTQQDPISFRGWVETEYDPAEITAAFDAKKGKS